MWCMKSQKRTSFRPHEKSRFRGPNGGATVILDFSVRKHNRTTQLGSGKILRKYANMVLRTSATERGSRNRSRNIFRRSRTPGNRENAKKRTEAHARGP